MHRPDSSFWVARLTLAALIGALPARAAEAELVVIADAGSPALGRKLRAEIAYAGLRAVEPASLAAAPATLRVLSAERVQLTVQRAGDATDFEQTIERGPVEEDSFALRVVEALRARLVEVGWTLPAPGRPEGASTGAPPEAATSSVEPRAASEASSDLAPRSPEAADALAASRSSRAEVGPLRFWLGGGAMASWSFAGLGVTPHAALSARAELEEVWGVTLLAQLPLLDDELEAAEGEARVAWSTFSVFVDRGLPVPAPWVCSVGLGAALLVLDAAGQGSPQFSGQRERLTAGGGLVAFGFGRELTGWLRLRAMAQAGAIVPRPVFHFDQREVASLGRAFGSLGLVLELGWPAAEPAP